MMGTAATVVLVATFFLADGQILSAEGGEFESYAACKAQAEADAKIMEHELERIESELSEPGILEVRIVCEPMSGHDGHTGYIPRGASHE